MEFFWKKSPFKKSYHKKTLDFEDVVSKLHETVLLIIGLLIGLAFSMVFRKISIYCRTDNLDLDNIEMDYQNQVGIFIKRNNFMFNRDHEPIQEEKNLIYIGVMTAQEFLETRARSTHLTWAKSLPGKINFFSRSNSFSDIQLPLVSLPGVDDAYPPQKKSFRMLKYMYENYLDKYEWFMRADDDVYIKVDELEKMLRSLNSSKALYIGQPGFGTKKEFGKLRLQQKESFCMGGPGLIMSKETLRRIGPHLDFCYQNLVYSYHEDVEIGRCINKFANITCTLAYEMKHLFHHISNQSDQVLTDFNSRKFRRTISLHPLKDSNLKFKIQNGININRITKLRHDFFNLKQESERLESTLQGRSLNPAKSRSYIITYDQFDSKNIISIDNKFPRRKIERHLKRNMNHTIEQIIVAINKNKIETKSEMLFIKTLHGYTRYNPLKGLDYIFLNLLRYKEFKGKKRIQTLKQIVHLHRPFTSLLFKEDTSLFISNPSKSPQSTSSNEELAKKTINFVLALSGRWNTFKNFMASYEKACLQTNENTKLVVVLYEHDSDPELIEEDGELLKQSDLIIKLMKTLKAKYPNQINFKTMCLIIKKAKFFSKSTNLQIGAQYYGEKDLIFFIDVDMIFTKELLYRIRLNTVENKQVYFPIVFNQYNQKFLSENSNGYSYSEFEFSSDSGHWRDVGFGMAGVYKSDWRSVDGFDTSIVGWGKEDVDFFDRFIVGKNLSVFRSVDPSLVHVYHEKICDINTPGDQYKMCINAKAIMYASNRILSNIFYEKSVLNGSLTIISI